PISVTVSVLTLTFNSVERLLAICFPLTFKTTKRRICNLIMLIWTVALVSNLHYPFKMEIEPFASLPKDQILLTQCRSTWGPKPYFVNSNLTLNSTGENSSAEMRGPLWIESSGIDPDTVAKVVDSMLFFVLPLAWMLIAYTMICRRLWYSAVPGQASGPAGQQSSANRTGDATLKQRRRTALMLIAIVLIFFLCYLPVHILRAAQGHISREDLFKNKQSAKKIVQSIVLFSHWICYFNSAINPIVYTFMSSRFRTEFLKIFSCCQRCQSAGAGGGSGTRGVGNGGGNASAFQQRSRCSFASPQRPHQQLPLQSGTGCSNFRMRQLNSAQASKAATAATVETHRLLPEKNLSQKEELSVVPDIGEDSLMA
uniref:G_PROTEIN_RECEP_F1_2 domain-containing protein n=1 Tax=Macrostomum lignano TaxID=282301 RepID=A0A1I8HJP5_9PLAT